MPIRTMRRPRPVARHGFGYHPIFREWLRLTDAGPDAVRRILCDDTERGRYMRSMAPLRQFISRGERADILRAVARRHGLAEKERDRRRAALKRLVQEGVDDLKAGKDVEAKDVFTRMRVIVDEAGR